MKTYYVKLSKPSRNHFIWAGPERQQGHLPSKESDRERHLREAVAARLEKFLGENKSNWKPRDYHFEVELTEEQATEISLWPGVKRVVEKQ